MQCFVRKFYSLCIIVFYVTRKKNLNEMFFKFTTATVWIHFFSHHFKKAGRPTGHLSFLKWRRCQKLNILLQKLSQYCVQLTSDELRTFVLEKSHSDGACKDFPLHSLERKTGRWHLCMWCHFIRTTQTVWGWRLWRIVVIIMQICVEAQNHEI